MDVYVVFADHPFEDACIFGVADLHDEVSASDFNLSLQNVVAVFRSPYDVRSHSSNTVAVMAIVLHSHASTIG
jgi:hypothetical protein